MLIQTHCPDGTDRHCTGTVPMELPFTGLSRDVVEPHWIEERGREKLDSITIYPPDDPRWLVENEPWLSNADIESIKCDGHFVIESDGFPDHRCCGPCGSSETYDDEGNNITAL